MSTQKSTLRRATTKGRCYAGLWRDGSPGWFAPSHICPGRSVEATRPNVHIDGDEWFYSCDVVLTVRLDKKGRPIRRRAKALGISKEYVTE